MIWEKTVVRRRTNTWKHALLTGALAFAPLIGLNLLLWLHINAHGRVDIQDAATSMLHLAESQLDQAMTQMVAF
jgi:hypothetical protein